MTYTSIFKPFSTRPHMQAASSLNFVAALHANFSIYTWLLLGASLQAAALSFLPGRNIILIASSVVLIARFLQTILQSCGILSNPYLKDVIYGRTTALLPNPATGEIEGAADRKIAVLHLGAKSNHPMGMFAPQFTKVGEWLGIMNDELDQGLHKGFLGQSTFQRYDERGALELVLISYWDSVEDLWAFAHSGTHRACWQWWEKTIKLNNAIGINHEIYEADANHWENIYVNFQPTLQGATTYIKRGNKLEGGVVSQEWVSPLVDARRGKLAKSSGRLGREVTRYDENRVAKDTYV